MSEKLIRVFKKITVDSIKEHVLICGDLFGNCSKCNAMGIKFTSPLCPECGTEFKYMTFRSLHGNLPKISKMTEDRPSLQFIDYDDFKHATGALKAEDLFKD